MICLLLTVSDDSDADVATIASTPPEDGGRGHKRKGGARKGIHGPPILPLTVHGKTKKTCGPRGFPVLLGEDDLTSAEKPLQNRRNPNRVGPY